MKTTLFYGFVMALAGSLLTYILFFLGYHDSVEKFTTAQTIASVVGLLIWITCLLLGIRARRDEVPAHEAFGYGRALGAGTLIALWGSLFGSISHAIYMMFVNPDFREVVVQSEIAKMEAKGVPAAQIEQAEGMVRMMTGPVVQSIFALIFGFILCFMVALIVAAFVRRPATGTPPPLA
ncbi:DUF4199 domain-containing protein [Oleiharenicola lentus]|jgi:hypothetical protein|uniref:DUF4199 domain-containing protein n=1 Tax=Oleiharenicola lentus TaxID=2508720 RepID=A0A4Q1C460_9BACT|nr:DUF4199 domain-containing protein [Oleiharenicola lentus]RXK53194.1 DUF4199 domain-containing protein [Oleiharenicola lentus]